MKLLFLLSIGIFGLGGNPNAASLPKNFKDIIYPSFSYSPPDPGVARVELQDGAVAYFVPDSTLDLLRVSLLTRHGVLPKNPGDAAAISIYSSLIKDGGVEGLSPDKIEDSLEFIAAGLSGGLGDWQSHGGFDTQSKYGSSMMELLSRVLLKPGLDLRITDLKKRESVEGIGKRFSTPRGVMGTLLEYVMYGSHPTNWWPTTSEIESLKKESLLVWKGRGFHRSDLVIAVSGRFDRIQMTQALNAFVTQFPAGKDTTAYRPFKASQKPGIYIVDKDFSQATITMAANSVQRPHQDFYPLVVASTIFGDGGFTSRLVEKVRSQEGLAYGISSDVGSDYHRNGLVTISLQTKAVTGAYAVKLVFAEMKRMRDSGVTDIELNRAKESLLRSLPSMFDTPSATASAFAQGEVWNRKADHYLAYQKTISEMKRAEVEEVFRKYFVPDSMRIVLVGPKKILTAKDATHQVSLSDFGEIKEVSISDLEKRE